MQAVVYLPDLLAGMTCWRERRMKSPARRIPASLITNTARSQGGKSRQATRAATTAARNILSATGSRIRPSWETWCKRRAR